MASSNRLKSTQIITNQSMTGTSTITSPAIAIQYLDNVYLQLEFTGTPNGTFSVQVSNDYNQDSLGNVTNVGNWVALTLSPAPVASGSANVIGIDMNQLGAPFIRVQYTNTSSTGTLNAFISGKELA
jgi:hypothetical protein